MEETREIFWNIGGSGHILYYLLIPLAALLGYAVYRRYRLWRLGRPDNRLSDLGKSLRAFIVTGIVDGLIHRRFLREPYPGLMHFLIFWGAIVFLLGAATDFVTLSRRFPCRGRLGIGFARWAGHCRLQEIYSEAGQTGQ